MQLLALTLAAVIVPAHAAPAVIYDQREDYRTVCARDAADKLKAGAGCVFFSATPPGCVIVTAPKPSAALLAEALALCKQGVPAK